MLHRSSIFLDECAISWEKCCAMHKMVLKRKAYTKILEWKEQYAPESITRLPATSCQPFSFTSKAPLIQPFSGAFLS